MSETATCPACEGTGETLDGTEICEPCEGAGYIEGTREELFSALRWGVCLVLLCLNSLLR